MILKAYLDTNLIIEHCWWKFFNNEETKITKEIELVEKGLLGDYDMCISYIDIMELSMHLTDWYLLEKVIASGFGYQNFRRERKEHSLTLEQKKFVNKIIEYYQNSPDVFYVEIDEINNEFFKRVKTLVDNYVEFEDALHYVFAQASQSDYFVTKDSELRVRIQNIISKKIIEAPEKPPMLIEAKNFLKLINKATIF